MQLPNRYYFGLAVSLGMIGSISFANNRSFGGWTIEKPLFDYIRTLLPEGKTILELGSGFATGEFAKFYTMYSIEHDSYWLGKYPTNYIYAPLVGDWYNPEILARDLPKNYDLILVDGPPTDQQRSQFTHHLDLFRTDVPIIFDDIDRGPDYQMLLLVAEKLNRPYEIHRSGSKLFGVILP